MTEIVLDPAEVAENRTALSLNTGAIRVGDEGPDWGDAQIEQHLADMRIGARPVDSRLPLRQIAIPLVVGANGRAAFDAARADLHAKVALIQREGFGWLKRGTGRYADIVSAALADPDRYTHLGVSEVVLTLEALPDFYGDEIDAGEYTTTGHELAFTLADVDGDHPARTRIVVTNDSTADQLTILGAFRSRDYSAASTARLAYAATDLDPLDAAVVSGDVVRHSSLGTSWTPVLGTNVAETTFMTHTGPYQVIALLTSPQGQDVQARFVSDVGDLVLPEEGPAWRFPGSSAYYLADLGQITLAKVPVGAHRWQGQVQARGAAGGEQIDVKRLWFLPVRECAFRIGTPKRNVEGLGDQLARDGFTGMAATTVLGGRTAPLGGSWVTSGAATDFAAADAPLATDETMVRSTTSDTGRGRIAVLNGANRVEVAHFVQFYASAMVDGVEQAAIARYVSDNAYAEAVLVHSGKVSGRLLQIRTRVAGVPATLASVPAPTAAATWYSVGIIPYSTGRVRAQLLSWPSGAVLAEVEATSTALATGGGLQTGWVGKRDQNTSATACTRYSDTVETNTPPPLDAALFGSRIAELRHDGCWRQTLNGAAYGPSAPPNGDVPRLPVSGMEARTVEVLLKVFRGDLVEPNVASPSGTPGVGTADAFRARVYYRPCWLFPTGG